MGEGEGERGRQRLLQRRSMATPDRLEIATSGRARCRACGVKIERGVLRFGEVLPGPYGEGEGEGTGVFWFHPRCAAHRRPEKFLVVIREAEAAATLADRDGLLAAAEEGILHERLPRVAGAERSASGRARCRHCKEGIPMGAWRIRLSSFADTGFFDPLGFLHVGCATAYFGTGALHDRLRQASPDLDAEALAELSSLEFLVS